MSIAVEPVNSSSAYIERQTLCISGSIPGLATHAGEEEFNSKLRLNYHADESNVAERLMHFKAELSTLNGEPFWTKLMEGMTDICHAQFAFVSKRILIDDQNIAVEMPRIGEEGSCLMAIALYHNDGKVPTGMYRDYKYHAWSCPCAYMKHDKVFLIDGNLSSFIQNNPNTIPIEVDSYLGVPLFAEGKCYAHFGMMWNKEGMIRRKELSWAFIELFMHSLEDLINAELLAGRGFAKSKGPLNQESHMVPQAVVTATQSLKVYARSLSHELRTPMQGVVGMLDLMYAAVQEQIESQGNQQIRQIFQRLKNNIEVIQDSSKRAVEAADNVVQAYDLNMQIPDTPSHEQEPPSAGNSTSGGYFDVKPTMTVGSQIVNPSKNKRKRSSDEAFGSGNARKFRHAISVPGRDLPTPPSPLRQAQEIEGISPTRTSPPLFTELDRPSRMTLPKFQQYSVEPDTALSTPSFRQSNIREALPLVINDSLRVGGRPDFAVSEPTTLGERIEVKIRSSNGHSSSKIVEWSVEPEVPYVLPIDEKDLSKLIGALFLNSLKFTDAGSITIRVRLSSSKRFVIISVADTGMGIPEAFQPELFKAFSKEDGAITRSTEGLGLGLMVAKGLARRIGGDLLLVRSAVNGPDRGSEFEMRIPLEPGDRSSRATTPMRLTDETYATYSVAPTSAPQLTPPPRTLTPLTENESPRQQMTKQVDLIARKSYSPPLALDTGSGSSKTPMKAPTIHRRVSSTPKVVQKPDRQLAAKHPLTFLVAEDNKINRKLLVQMLNTLGYKDVHEAYDGKEAIRVMERLVREKRNRKRRDSNINNKAAAQSAVDVILMDLWMPEMDGYEATEHILSMFRQKEAENIAPEEAELKPHAVGAPPTVLAISADVTDAAIDRATKTGMSGYMSKPFKVLDLQKLILEFCVPK